MNGLSGSAVIATLRTRDSELTILSEGGSLRYALVDALGVTQNLTLDELRAYDANLFEFVQSATARTAASLATTRGSASAPRASVAQPPGACSPGDPCRGSSFIDARVEPPARAPVPTLPAFALPIGAERGAAGSGRGLRMPARE
jgi:hypothetical protein